MNVDDFIKLVTEATKEECDTFYCESDLSDKHKQEWMNGIGQIEMCFQIMWDWLVKDDDRIEELLRALSNEEKYKVFKASHFCNFGMMGWDDEEEEFWFRKYIKGWE